MKKILLALVVLAFAGVIGWKLYQKMQPVESNPSIAQVHEEKGIPVNVVTVAEGPLAQWRDFTGTVEGIRQANVFTNVPARVKSIVKEVGDPVAKDAVIIRLDPSSGAQTQTMYEKARLDLDAARRAHARMKNLFEAGAISKADLENAEDAVRLARAALQDTNFNLDLESPIAGVVTKILTEVGENAEAGAALAVVADTSKVKIKLDMSTDEVKSVELDQIARCAHRNGKERCSMGKVTKVALSADPVTRLFAVEVTMDNPDGALRAGVIETVEIRVAEKDNALSVPREALVQSGGGFKVWVVDAAGKARTADVTIGLTAVYSIEITSGLQTGDRVVTFGQNLLKEDAKVLIRNGNSPA